MGYAVVCHPPGSYRGRSYFRDAKKRTKAEEAARRRKSSVAHCRGSQRPQRRTCESAVMGIMQNYGRAVRETRGDTWGLSNRRVRREGRGRENVVEQNSEEDLREGSRTRVPYTVSRDIECFSWITRERPWKLHERDYKSEINITRVTVGMFLQSRMWRMHSPFSVSVYARGDKGRWRISSNNVNYESYFYTILYIQLSLL